MAKKGIKKYSETSDLMNISIKWQRERFHFNLYEELVIDADRINHELQVQPSSYAFINMLWKKLVLATEDAKINWEKVQAKEYIRFKKEVNDDTGRVYNDDLAKASSLTSKLTSEAYREYKEMKNQANILETCVKSFEMRSNLIQTLSANHRNESRNS